MHLCKFKYILVLAFINLSNTSFAFEDNECLNGSFDVEVIHKGQPFGLLPVRLLIKKENCKLTVFHEKFKYIKKNWSIDVCREPVHLKKGVGAVEVIKKTTLNKPIQTHSKIP